MSDRGRIAKLGYSLTRSEKAKRDRVFITHSGCDEEIIANVKAYIEEMNYFNEILITQAGCVVTSHCGPGTLGVLFVAGE